jgi:hypothetical protein
MGEEDLSRFRAVAQQRRVRAADARSRAKEDRRSADVVGDPWLETELRARAAALSIVAASEELDATLDQPSGPRHEY